MKIFWLFFSVSFWWTEYYTIKKVYYRETGIKSFRVLCNKSGNPNLAGLNNKKS